MKTRPTLILALALLALAGCADMQPSASQPPLVNTETSVRPQTAPLVPMSRGSLVPAPQNSQMGYRGLFEERRASRVGDTLTVVLNEMTHASKDGGTKARRDASNTSQVGAKLTNNRTGTGASSRGNDFGVGVSNTGNVAFNGTGAATASNQFNGTIAVTVVEVLPNGNLKVAGEKRLAVGAEEEVIRFGGVVYPLHLQGNTVLSSQVADARIEYRGAGFTDEIQRPGWLTRTFSKYLPN